MPGGISFFLTAMRQIWSLPWLASLALACLTKLKILTKHERILISYKFFHIKGSRKNKFTFLGSFVSSSPSVNGKPAFWGWLVIAAAIMVPELLLNTSWLNTSIGLMTDCSCPMEGLRSAQLRPRPFFLNAPAVNHPLKHTGLVQQPNKIVTRCSHDLSLFFIRFLFSCHYFIIFIFKIIRQPYRT